MSTTQITAQGLEATGGTAMWVR